MTRVAPPESAGNLREPSTSLSSVCDAGPLRTSCEKRVKPGAECAVRACPCPLPQHA
jgi:hypothetical protein